ncbi:Acid stress-induced BolA-like protein IbaG/YrbA, predicted regulator of iron metabolism [Allopseudospirillum japonicum]|uniref:Acid stress-induced BolA-like protein IbaG/YrbA, predicted regulator of iron metabolism n=1 Tax=Allopseudospirillum japonicum TaxID=64971 RepID=A0A1H6Q820_9GAMM|nr:BolA/IbaG family iron-sulfur metabolism protein [Allopseudospirillum japonicum]SEI39908.1 Acid stress-induced BolA-like protein IbaG/YrbA, predicted regulator of iron metabolism [Allopseudospirillum japonicum]
MTSDQVRDLLSTRLPACDFYVQGEGSKFAITAVGDVFTELKMPVKKQQYVYAGLQEEIASGAIHAVTIKTYTPEQWQNAQHLQVG